MQPSVHISPSQTIDGDTRRRFRILRHCVPYLVPVLLFLVPFFFRRYDYDAFEAPKRLLWICLAFVLASHVHFPRSVRWGTSLLVYQVVVTLVAFGTDANLYALTIWILPVLLFALSLGHRWGEDGKDLIGRSLLCCGLLQALLMLFQHVGLDPLFPELTSGMDYRPQRMIGTIGYHNQAAEFLGVCLTGLFWVKWRGRYLSSALAIPILLALILTLNRGAILAVAAAAVAVFLSRKVPWRSSRPYLCLLLLVAAFLLLHPVARSRVLELTRPSRSPAVQTRLWMARVACAQILDEPFLGHGAGAYGREYMGYLRQILPREKNHGHLPYLVYAQESHNDLLQFIDEFGVIGLSLLLLFLIAAYRERALMRDGAKEKGAILYLLVFMGVVSSFSFSWQSAVAGPLAAILLGVALSPGTGRKPFRLGRGAHKLVLLLLSLALVAETLELAYSARYGETDEPPEPFPPILARAKWIALEGQLLVMKGEWPGAERLLAEAREREESPTILSNLGAALLEQGKLDEAEEVFRKWEQSGLLHAEALRNLSIVEERKGDFEACARIEKRRQELFLRDFSNQELFRSVVCYLRAGWHEKALYVTEKFYHRCQLRARSSWTPEWENLLGVCYLKNGQTDRARRSFQIAVKRNPELLSARKNLEGLGASRPSAPASGR